MPPHASDSAARIRPANSGQVAGATRAASCAQYSTTTRRGVAHPIQRLAVIGAEAAEERQVMTARHDVDAVDLDDAEPVNDAAQVPGANRAGCGRGAVNP